MKIVFVLNAVQNQRCIKRVEEFINQGYDVDVYAFSRNSGMNSQTIHFPVSIIGNVDNGSPIRKRFPVLFQAFRQLCARYKSKPCIFYLFKMDLVMVFRIVDCHHPYIYEESDLTHLDLSSPLARKVFNRVDRHIIKKSFMTVFTSEGFVKYYFGDKCPQNVHVIPNRLNQKIEKLDSIEKSTLNIASLKIGFVGWPRFKSVLNFIRVFCKTIPKGEMHVYGGPLTEDFDEVKSIPNCYLHGPFHNPDDLPRIYSSIDLVLSTYDVESENVRWAEPNKMYESIYFNTPIIVSSGTFLADKVEELGIGFHVDALNDNEIVLFLRHLTKEVIEEKVNCIKKYPKTIAVNRNDDFFEKLKSKINAQ